MKAFPAILAALAITVVVGAAMFVIGGNALLNQNNVPITNSPSISNISNVSTSAGTTAQQVTQLQSLVQQYQQREQQYQQQLTDATKQTQQYQSLLQQLQARGVIRIGANGQISIPRRVGD